MREQTIRDSLTPCTPPVPADYLERELIRARASAHRLR